MAQSTLSSVTPRHAVEGGRLILRGAGFSVDPAPAVTLGATPAHVFFASASRLVVEVPADLPGGALDVRVAGASSDGYDASCNSLSGVGDMGAGANIGGR
jgi:hypothetical protein